MMDIIYEKKSPYSLEETIARFKEVLPNHGFGILWELNFKKKLEEKGLSLAQDFIVFEVCNPAKAENVLSQLLQAGYFLPCKMAVYQKEKEVFIGLPKPEQLITLVTNDDLLKAFAEDVEAILVEVVNTVVGEEN